MNPWPRRLTYLAIILVWLVVLSLPYFAFRLATRGQLQLGSDPDNHVRLFLLQEAAAEGIGLERARPAPANPSCTLTTVSYFMWVGAPENVTYCQCYDPATGDPLPVTPNACAEP